MKPTPEEVASYLGRDGDPSTIETVATHLPVTTQMVRAYTRDRGFDPVTGDPVDDVAAAIVSATARTVTNPSALTQQTVGPFNVSYQAINGWSLAELAVLHRYRKRAM